MRNIFYSSRVIVKCCTKEILCAHRRLKIRANIGPILIVLYTADAENNRCAGPPPPLLHKRYIALLLYFRVDGFQPTQAQSIQVWVLSFYGSPPPRRRLLPYIIFALGDTEVRPADTNATLESTLTAVCLWRLMWVLRNLMRTQNPKN